MEQVASLFSCTAFTAFFWVTLLVLTTDITVSLSDILYTVGNHRMSFSMPGFGTFIQLTRVAKTGFTVIRRQRRYGYDMMLCNYQILTCRNFEYTPALRTAASVISRSYALGLVPYNQDVACASLPTSQGTLPSERSDVS